MTIESALYNYLSTHSDVSAFFNEIKPVELSETPDYPALVYQKIDGPEDHNIPFAHPRIQIDIYAEGDGPAAYDKAKEGAEIIKSVMKGFKGHFRDVPIKFVELVNNNDVPTQENLRRVSQDYRIHYKL